MFRGERNLISVSTPFFTCKDTYQWNPAKLEPSTALCLHNLGIVATRADVWGAITLLLDLVRATENDRDTEEKVLYLLVHLVVRRATWKENIVN